MPGTSGIIDRPRTGSGASTRPGAAGPKLLPQVRPGWSNVVYESHRVKGPAVCFTLPAWAARVGSFAARVALVAKGR